MGTTTIEWTHYSFQPWIGCSKVSPACKHCYAEALVNARPALVLGPGVPRAQDGRRLPVWGEEAPRRVTSAAYWQQPLAWNRKAQRQGVRRRVFCASLADVFELARPATGREDELRSTGVARANLWLLIEQTSTLDWLLLTKRPQHVLRMVPATWLAPGGWPSNVWVGTTVEDQQRAEERLPHLLQVPAPVRFVSYEPALESVDFGAYLHDTTRGGVRFSTRGIDWVIVGGESGPHARPFDLQWARQALAQCRAAGVPCFVKQLGRLPWIDAALAPPADLRRPIAGRAPFGGLVLKLKDPKGGAPEEWPADLRVREIPEVRR